MILSGADNGRKMHAAGLLGLWLFNNNNNNNNNGIYNNHNIFAQGAHFRKNDIE